MGIPRARSLAVVPLGLQIDAPASSIEGERRIQQDSWRYGHIHLQDPICLDASMLQFPEFRTNSPLTPLLARSGKRSGQIVPAFPITAPASETS